MNKYSSKKTIIDNIEFHSEKEAIRYSELKLLQKAGEISKLELQPKFILQEEFIDIMGKKHRPITYIADFKYCDKKHGWTVEDTKGFKTKEYLIKKKLFLKHYPLRFLES